MGRENHIRVVGEEKRMTEGLDRGIPMVLESSGSLTEDIANRGDIEWGRDIEWGAGFSSEPTPTPREAQRL